MGIIRQLLSLLLSSSLIVSGITIPVNAVRIQSSMEVLYSGYMQVTEKRK